MAAKKTPKPNAAASLSKAQAPSSFDHDGLRCAISELMAATVREIEESSGKKREYWTKQKIEGDVTSRIAAFKAVFGAEVTAKAVVSSEIFIACLTRGFSNVAKAIIDDFGSAVFGFWTLKTPDPILGEISGPVGICLISEMEFLVEPLVARGCPMTEREAALCAHKMPAFVASNHSTIQKCIVSSIPLTPENNKTSTSSI